MNPGSTPARIGCSHFSDKIADFTTDTGSSRAFGFEFPEKFKTLSVPTDNAIRLYNNKRFAPREPNSGKQNPEESIRHSNFRSLVRPFHYGQLLAKRKVLDSEIRGDYDLRQYERNKISKCFHHDYSLAGAYIFVNKFIKYEYLRRTTFAFIGKCGYVAEVPWLSNRVGCRNRVDRNAPPLTRFTDRKIDATRADFAIVIHGCDCGETQYR